MSWCTLNSWHVVALRKCEPREQRGRGLTQFPVSRGTVGSAAGVGWWLSWGVLGSMPLHPFFCLQKYPEHAVYKVLQLMLRRGELQHRMQRKVLYRLK